MTTVKIIFLLAMLAFLIGGIMAFFGVGHGTETILFVGLFLLALGHFAKQPPQ